LEEALFLLPDGLTKTSISSVIIGHFMYCTSLIFASLIVEPIALFANIKKHSFLYWPYLIVKVGLFFIYFYALVCCRVQRK
jgi:hypothetical protein